MGLSLECDYLHARDTVHDAQVIGDPEAVALTAHTVHTEVCAAESVSDYIAAVGADLARDAVDKGEGVSKAVVDKYGIKVHSSLQKISSQGCFPCIIIIPHPAPKCKRKFITI